MSVKDFALPDLGEGLTESELVAWRVAVGDTVELNQVIAEVETAKALVELPSPYSGIISKLYAEPGATVAVGAPIVAFEIGDDEGAEQQSAPDVADADATGEAASAPKRESVLVGYGPAVASGEPPRRRARRSGGAPPEPATAPAAAGGESAAVTAATAPEPAADAAPAPAAEAPAPVATEPATEQQRSTPPVRKHARDLGIDLATLTGTGEHGLITREDVDAAAPRQDGAASLPPGAATTPRPELADRADETRVPIAGVRKRTAAAMVQSAFTAPHAAAQLTVDVTATEELMESLASTREFRDIRLTIMTLVAKALCLAVARNPSINSRWDEAAGEIVTFRHVNLGIAAATERGLVVPNVKSAESLNLADLARAVSAVVESARAGTSTPAEFSGGTITLTNIGVFGVDSGIPILNPGEAAILAVGAVRRQPWEHRGEIALRSVLTLTLSFDHRLIDGEQGSRFLADVGAILRDPGVALTMV
ncbi:dihydrolipoamide acetyltransferase family protein [Salinibacterium sp. ZJ450]|uniref:dihydrolipoamide acetyltransferase family protein n=1 Tax=Salinibacterium sp. ZJ450 TaxID=2708338 RepID=UPI0014238051|nr:dihydrolipoamide acetyltransferase family protein [Salinibacterium sp. ZJ450]